MIARNAETITLKHNITVTASPFIARLCRALAQGRIDLAMYDRITKKGW